MLASGKRAKSRTVRNAFLGLRESQGQYADCKDLECWKKTSEEKYPE